MDFIKILFVALLLSLVSCKVEPQKINYGQDQCAFCNMTLVDKTHASEYVTKKGKSYKFDAIECMVQKINQELNEENLAYILVTNYQKPETLIDAQNASYLITKKIKSPMGAYLSAFSSLEKTKKIQSELGGKIYNWKQLKVKFSN